MPIFAPAFCKGVGVSQALGTLALGARVATPTSTAGFAVGQHLFASNADGTLAAYLGKIRLVSGGKVTFQFASPRAWSGSGRIFVPAAVWQAGRVSASGGADQTRESGIETLETTGKEMIHTRIREARDYVELTIRHVDSLDWAAYKVFLRDYVADGLSKFVAAYRDVDTGAVRCDVVKLRAPGEALSAKSDARVLRSWAVGLQVVQSGIYA